MGQAYWQIDHKVRLSFTSFTESLKYVSKSVSVSVYIGKINKISNGIGMLFFGFKKLVSISVCYSVLIIGIGKIKVLKIGWNRYR